MGYGGALIWTGLFRNLKKKYPAKKIILIYNKSLKRKVLSVFKNYYPDQIIFKNNPDIHKIIDKLNWKILKYFYNKNSFVIDINDPQYIYCSNETNEKIEYITGKHAIAIACEVENIINPQLQPRIVLTEKEKKKAFTILQNLSLKEKKIICIEPNIKKDFTENKAWEWQRWQQVVDKANNFINNNYPDVKIIQIGAPDQPVLNGVINLAGKLSFRETAYILERSLFFISYMGGLIHLSRAVNTVNINLISAWEPLELASYPGDINFYSNVECKNCGLKTPCPYDRKCMKNITVAEVYNAFIHLLKEKYQP